MTCPNCDYTGLRPTRTDGTIRSYQCWRCQARFETVEMLRDVSQRQAYQATLWKIVNGGGDVLQSTE